MAASSDGAGFRTARECIAEHDRKPPDGISSPAHQEFPKAPFLALLTISEVCTKTMFGVESQSLLRLACFA